MTLPYRRESRFEKWMSFRGPKGRGNLLVPFTEAQSKPKHGTGRFPRQGFALPRNDRSVVT